MTAALVIDREVWAKNLAWLCHRLIEAVHAPLEETARKEGVRRALWHVLSLTPPEGVDPAGAALVALAAMVPAQRDPDSRLEWVRALGDELDWVQVPA